MKAPRPAPAQPYPEAIVEEIVEDLGQQDVLPTGTGSEVMTSNDAEMVAEEQASRWDDPVGGQGHQAGRTPLEDETNPSEVLVQRGVNEAAEELRELDDAEAPAEETE